MCQAELISDYLLIFTDRFSIYSAHNETDNKNDTSSRQHSKK